MNSTRILVATNTTGGGMRRCNFHFRFVAAFILVCVASFPQFSSAETIDARATFLPIDISKSNARVQAKIEIKTAALYIFYFDVHYRNEEERKRVFTLIGSSRRLNNGGGYADPGTTIPMHVKLVDGTGAVLLDTVNSTQGNAGHGLGVNLSGEYIREIAEIHLTPGVYKFSVEILEKRSEFHGLESAIAIGTRPHTN
ncbi:DUF5625 family protein [Burkholderia ubonensis]|uniref:DUF5625 family protein n=1 Tax=Burkholderia ubonensis TaxID=101571 RepID=UPI00358FDDFE